MSQRESYNRISFNTGDVHRRGQVCPATVVGTILQRLSKIVYTLCSIAWRGVDLFIIFDSSTMGSNTGPIPSWPLS